MNYVLSVLLPSNLPFSHPVRNPIIDIKGTSVSIKIPQPYPEVFQSFGFRLECIKTPVRREDKQIQNTTATQNAVKIPQPSCTTWLGLYQKCVLIMPYL